MSGCATAAGAGVGLAADLLAAAPTTAAGEDAMPPAAVFEGLLAPSATGLAREEGKAGPPPGGRAVEPLSRRGAPPLAVTCTGTAAAGAPFVLTEGRDGLLAAAAAGALAREGLRMLPIALFGAATALLPGAAGTRSGLLGRRGAAEGVLLGSRAGLLAFADAAGLGSAAFKGVGLVAEVTGAPG